MKKVLFASTALVAAGMMMTAATASASEKIKLNVGGFSKWWVVGQFNQDSYTAATPIDINSVDIKGDNEIFFGGSTTLDNGMKVGVQVELEAGGHTETSTGPVDVIDESYAWLETGFGKFIVGSENNGAYLLHVQAPDAAGNWGEGGVMTSDSAIARPAAVTRISGGNTTAVVTDNDADKITYVAPTFMGLTVGASYAPSSSEDNRGVTNITAQTTGEIYGVGALYANTFGDVGLKVSGGWVAYDLETGFVAGDTDITEWTAGTQVSFAGFTLGGSYRNIDAGRAVIAREATAWDVGVQYATGPYAVSLAYFQSKVGNVNEDKTTFIQASGKYNLGAGVDVLASVGHADYDDGATATAGNNNKGWTVMTGLGLSF